MKSVPGWRKRAFYLSCLIVVPFLNFLASQRYGVLFPESAAAILLLIIPCVLLALLFRGKFFYALVVACLGIVCTYPLCDFVRPAVHLRIWTCAAIVLVGSAALVALMRERFLVIMAVFSWSGLLAVGLSQITWPRTYAQSHSSLPEGSVLWLLLDEQIGLAGFPDCPACQAAKADLSKALADYNFTLYPNAYSNYGATVDSVPSLLNSRLLKEPGELIGNLGPGYLRQYVIKGNQTFEHFRDSGFQVVAYQHASLRWCDPSVTPGDCRPYSEKLVRFRRAPGTWTQRFAWLVGEYQATDPVRRLVLAFFPVREEAHIVGPLNVADLWPNGLAKDILSTRKRAFFFVHLLTPHAPYLYRPDGSLRPFKQWAGDRADERMDIGTYNERYVRYCEQVQFVARQLRQFLTTLQQAGVLDDMTVVVHGDHGSRIRRILTRVPPGPSLVNVDAEMYDYSSQPDLRDLLDHFSTLLAIHKPGSEHSDICYDKHSLLTLLARELYGKEPADGVTKSDYVYMMKNPTQYRSVDILNYWRN